jgi:hypothetical protein
MGKAIDAIVVLQVILREVIQIIRILEGNTNVKEKTMQSPGMRRAGCWLRCCILGIQIRYVVSL